MNIVNSADEQAEWFKNVKSLIEETYYSNGNKKVVTIGHSMGNPYMLYFFNHQTQVGISSFENWLSCIRSSF